jgi:hypothetical protein
MVKRYQRHNQKPYIKEGQWIQWPKDTKGITKSSMSKTDGLPLVYFGHCINCPSLIYGFWFCFGICWPLYWLSVFDIRLLVMPWYLLAIALTVRLWYRAFGYAFGIFWSLYSLSFFDIRLNDSQYNGQQIPKAWPEAVYQRRSQYNGQQIPKA